MSKAAKIWMIVAAALILLGAVIFAAVMSLNSWNFMCLSTKNFRTTEHVISEDFKNIDITSRTAKITFLPSEDGKARVICYEEEKVKNEVSVSDNTLKITRVDTRRWYDHIGIFNFGTAKITVYLPKDQLGELNIKSSTGDIAIPNGFNFGSVSILVGAADVEYGASSSGKVKIHTSTGDIFVQNISCGEMDILVDTGRIKASGVACTGNFTLTVDTADSNVSDVTCRSFISKGDTGSLYMVSVFASDKFSIERNTGDVNFKLCDASEADIVTDTGEVVGSFVTDKMIFASTDTGKVRIPKLISGGRCEIITDTGDIIITIAK